MTPSGHFSFGHAYFDGGGNILTEVSKLKKPKNRQSEVSVVCDDMTGSREELAEWLETAGDLDDFIFYSEINRPSER